ncbi:MAG: hypothetical protein AAF843_17025 [Bacteroidota bacterium]
MMQDLRYSVRKQEKNEVIKSLKEDILLNPKMKHRLILKAIKTEGDPEVQKLIRWYNKRGLL